MGRDFKLFLSYVSPSMAAMIIAGSYSIIDTVFIGLGMGEIGLASIALTWPLILIIWGIGDMLGNGAAALISQYRGASLELQAQKAFGNMITLLFAISIPIVIITILFLDPLLTILGANKEMMLYAYPYAFIMISGSIFELFSMQSIAVIRNDGRPYLAMWLVMIGLCLNVFFDWLLIIFYNYGAAGAAWATILSQSIAALCGLVYFLSPYTKLNFALKNLKADFAMMKKVFVTGIPMFGAMLVIVAMLFMHNIQSIRYGGVEGLAAYTLVACLESAGSMLLTGLACGVQPLTAYLYGAGEHKRKNKIGNYGYLSAFVIGVLMMLFSFALRNEMPCWCGLTGSTAKLAANGVLISSTAFLFLGVIRVASYYYQSTGKILYSSILIYGDAFAALPLCLFTLPIWFGMDGVWLAMPVSRVILMIVLCYFWFCKGYKKYKYSAA